LLLRLSAQLVCLAQGIGKLCVAHDAVYSVRCCHRRRLVVRPHHRHAQLRDRKVAPGKHANVLAVGAPQHLSLRALRARTRARSHANHVPLLVAVLLLHLCCIARGSTPLTARCKSEAVTSVLSAHWLTSLPGVCLAPCGGPPSRGPAAHATALLPTAAASRWPLLALVRLALVRQLQASKPKKPR